MGLLDSSDDDIKNQLKYKDAVKAHSNLGEEVKKFTSKGGTGGLVQGLAQKIRAVIMKCDKGAEAYPNFSGWQPMRDEALEVGKALIEKHPQHSALSNFKEYVDDPKKRY